MSSSVSNTEALNLMMMNATVRKEKDLFACHAVNLFGETMHTKSTVVIIAPRMVAKMIFLKL